MNETTIVKAAVERAPAVQVRYYRHDDPRRWLTAWVVIACPFCDKPHRHAAKASLGAIVTAGCGASKGQYRDLMSDVAAPQFVFDILGHHRMIRPGLGGVQ